MTPQAGKLAKGDRVEIYDDPVSKNNREGVAVLVKRLHYGDLPSTERWLVEFEDERGRTYERIIHVQ